MYYTIIFIFIYFIYSGFPKVVAFVQPKLVAQTKVVAFSAQLLLETHYIMLYNIYFSELKKNNIYENTNIIITSDHGMTTIDEDHLILLDPQGDNQLKRH